MFIVLVTYKKSLEVVDHYLAEHRLFLEEGYRQNLLMTWGPRSPRTGGVVLSRCGDRAVLEAFLAQDPFWIHEVAVYEIIEFTPVKRADSI